jgi:hypothetical protein
MNLCKTWTATVTLGASSGEWLLPFSQRTKIIAIRARVDPGAAAASFSLPMLQLGSSMAFVDLLRMSASPFRAKSYIVSYVGLLA